MDAAWGLCRGLGDVLAVSPGGFLLEITLKEGRKSPILSGSLAMLTVDALGASRQMEQANPI